jgi:hypothetical protein
MSKFQDNYKWEAEKADGNIITKGGDISGCVRYSAIPQIPGLPRHDILGKKLKRRFNRGFQKMVLSKNKARLEHLRTEAKSEELVIIDSLDAISKKKVQEYKDYRKAEPADIPKHKLLQSAFVRAKKIKDAAINALWLKYHPTEQYYLCCVFQGGRLWIDSRTGNTLLTSEKYELYI